jgi:hypothetical protein
MFTARMILKTGVESEAGKRKMFLERRWEGQGKAKKRNSANKKRPQSGFTQSNISNYNQMSMHFTSLSSILDSTGQFTGLSP